MADVEFLISDYSDKIVKALEAQVPKTSHEDEIKVCLSSRLQAFVASAGLNVEGKIEYALAGGRIDSKFGAVMGPYRKKCVCACFY
jgi:hypothetical protein